jgi:hypothetical protein
MIRNIEIMNFENTRKTAKLEDFENVVRLEIRVISGDEILNILYKDYSVKAFDSDTNRTENYFDAHYCIYDITNNINHLDKWNKRNSSYDIKLEE